MWIGDTAYKRPEKLPLFFKRLQEMGVNTAMVYGGGDPKPLTDAGFPYYVENLVNRGLCLKFNSKVTDWDKFVTDWARDGRSETALVRDYCLDDPQWLGWARGEVRAIVEKNKPHKPLAYNLRDELSTTISANPFDYDYNPMALAGFRTWLKTQYESLERLNEEWDTGFKTWDEVKPFTTDEIKARMIGTPPGSRPDWAELQRVRFDSSTARLSPKRWNFSPWADFRSYMDLSLARALDELRKLAREVDPATPVGIEGTQMPSAFGGYDLWRLAQVLDWVEPYDIGNAREILGSFMPNRPILTTVFETDAPHARRRLWHLLLEGDRGCLVWWSEDCIDWRDENYSLTAKARALAPVLCEMTSPLARLFLSAQGEHDPVLIHYSQASIQADWLIESTIDGSTWLRRFSSFEADHNRMVRVRNVWLKTFQDLGFSPQFISSEAIERGGLARYTNAVLVLPGSVALSDTESSSIQAGLNSNPANLCSVFFDGVPGSFDGHARLRKNGPAAPFDSERVTSERVVSVLSKSSLFQLDTDVSKYGAARLRDAGSEDFRKWISSKLGTVAAPVLVPAGARVRVNRFVARHGKLLAFERNIDYQMSEDLKQAGGNEALEKPIEVQATLPQPMHLYDLRGPRYLGLTSHLQFTLEPWQPSLFAVTTEKRPVETLISDMTN